MGWEFDPGGRVLASMLKALGSIPSTAQTMDGGSTCMFKQLGAGGSMTRGSRSSPLVPTFPAIATLDVPKVAQWLATQPAFSTVGHDVLQPYALRCAVTHPLFLSGETASCFTAPQLPRVLFLLRNLDPHKQLSYSWLEPLPRAEERMAAVPRKQLKDHRPGSHSSA